ncbi:MAG TPA: exodeoxyribonuclease VII small subunit [Bacteroidales bacterium]|nr:exodeoxyribonuclease VII small subunit [Bacteroidales bacterium]
MSYPLEPALRPDWLTGACIVNYNQNRPTMSESPLTYNKAMQEVEQILAALEKNNPDVDLMSQQVKRAVELLQQCRQKLVETDEAIKQVFEQLNPQG